MNPPLPGAISIRAVNQYRRRDVLPYLALRYYLASSAARADGWARQVSTDLVLTRSTPAYLSALHFKGCDNDGAIEHRRLFLPGANEALAEAALIDECSRHPLVFCNPSSVFSYELSQSEERAGIFKPYFGGLQGRHEAIAAACDACPNGTVRYVDIRRFYPSIDSDLALKVWRENADIGGLPPQYRELGEKLIRDYRNVGQQRGQGILTGPMFAHLIGNLVLRKIDETSRPVRYFRYVDDIVLVGEPEAVEKSLRALHSQLADIGLELHDDSSPKSIRVHASEWIEGRDDFRESRRTLSWKTFMSDLKKFLLLNPDKREDLTMAFRSEDIRIPLLDYSGVIREANYLQRLQLWIGLPWFRRKANAISLKGLVRQALWLRQTYKKEFRELVYGAENLQGFALKRRIPKLRYRAGRLIYLGSEEDLSLLSSEAAGLNELRFHSEIMAAVSSRNIDDLLFLGSNAAQAAAQPLRAGNQTVFSSSPDLGETERQGIAVFLLNGVSVQRHEPEDEPELIRLARIGSDWGLMRSNDPFTRELACLHGLTSQPRHSDTLESAFDEDEPLVLDAIDQMRQSLSL
jgi:hypothetical protein